MFKSGEFGHILFSPPKKDYIWRKRHLGTVIRFMENVTSLAKMHLLTERYPAAKLILKADKCLRTLVFGRLSWNWIGSIVVEMQQTVDVHL